MVVIVHICCVDWFCRSKGSRTIASSSVNEINRYCSGGCGGNIPFKFAYTGYLILVYGYLWSRATDISEDARWNIIDDLLTLIFKMGSGACSSLYCSKRRPLLSFWLCATSSPPDYLWFTTNNCSCSLKTQFQEVVQSVSLFVINIMAAGTSKTVSYIPLSILCI